MSDGPLRVVINAARGRGGVREFPVQRIEAYTFDVSMDTDSDAFSVDIGDPHGELSMCTDRDTEVRCVIFGRNPKGQLFPVFSGIADKAQYGTSDYVLSIQGRDQSLLALGDAPPGRWRHVQPANFIKQRAVKIGMQVNRIHRMAEIGTLYTDGSETEWAFWYRLVRSRGMFMWTEPLGGLVIDHLAYSVTPSYFFGSPPRGANRAGWVMPDEVTLVSDKDRQGQVWVYAEDNKSGKTFVARGIDTSIHGWRRKPIRIISSSTAKSQADAKKEADDEVFESIVGKQEVALTIDDVGLVYKQNQMARLNIPELDLAGDFFVIGVSSRGGGEGKSQVLRLREKGYALSKRVPTAPVIQKDPGIAAITSQVSSVIRLSGVRWSDSFLHATNEFGVAGGWDLGVFLGALLSICQQESGFANVRQGSHLEWLSWEDYSAKYGVTPGQSGPGTRRDWEYAFANEADNPLIGYEAGVGPMQLTTHIYKEWADQYGWLRRPKVGEYEGGRWNPESNIRAAARALVEKAKTAPVLDPTKADNIWIAVSRYHGSSDPANNAAYVASVKSIFKSQFQSLVNAAITASSTKNVGTDRSYQINGYGNMKLPDVTPDSVVKAINFCMNRRGDPYKWGGFGPYYDCSGLVTAAYMSAHPDFRFLLKGRGETTYTLFAKGRFTSVLRDDLLPGDLVFFHGNPPEHVGMYLQDGLFVHDPHTGDVVRVSSISESYYSENYTGARRLVAWTSPR